MDGNFTRLAFKMLVIQKRFEGFCVGLEIYDIVMHLFDSVESC